MNKKITKKGYRVLAVIWTLAAASMGVAFVRRLAEFSLFLLLMFLLSLLTAYNFWTCWRRADEAGDAPPSLNDAPLTPHGHVDLFGSQPKFADNPELFDDDPPPAGPAPADNGPNQDSEEKDHE